MEQRLIQKGKGRIGQREVEGDGERERCMAEKEKERGGKTERRKE